MVNVLVGEGKGDVKVREDTSKEEEESEKEFEEEDEYQESSEEDGEAEGEMKCGETSEEDSEVEGTSKCSVCNSGGFIHVCDDYNVMLHEACAQFTTPFLCQYCLRKKRL